MNANHVYWATSTSLLRGGSARSGGPTSTVPSPQAIATGQTSPSGVAVDADSYWTTSSTDGSSGSCGPAWTGATLSSSLEGIRYTVGLATDGSQLYWTDGHNGTVNASNQNGGNRRVLVRGQNAPLGSRSSRRAPDVHFPGVASTRTGGEVEETSDDDRPPPWVRPLFEVGQGDLRIAGGKGANLGELIRGGVRVRPGSSSPPRPTRPPALTARSRPRSSGPSSPGTPIWAAGGRGPLQRDG